jgi:hypothetical protein
VSEESESCLPDGGLERPGAMYPLYAQTKRGFFGLRQLNEFCVTQLEPLVGLEQPSTFVLDFRDVAVWDVSAILWLVIALQHYKMARLSFRLKLPEASTESKDDPFGASADYLRRWRFDQALGHVGDLEALLVPEQAEYFTEGPRTKYLDTGSVLNRSGKRERLLSGRLREIRDLTRVDSRTRRRYVSSDEINACIQEFEEAGISNILYNLCAISKDDADYFAVHLVGEALLNMEQHPNATTGLLAVSVMGNSRELVLAVVDNGDSIPSTILDVFNNHHESHVFLESASLEDKRRMVDYATQAGVSRKQPRPDKKVGQGLTYIKEDTVDRFGGKLRIITESAQLVFQGHSSEEPEPSHWPHAWRGNLLRISIPLK